MLRFRKHKAVLSTHSHMDSGKPLSPAITHKPAHRGEHQEEGKWGRGCPLVAVAVPEVVERGISEWHSRCRSLQHKYRTNCSRLCRTSSVCGLQCVNHKQWPKQAKKQDGVCQSGNFVYLGSWAYLAEMITGLWLLLSSHSLYSTCCRFQLSPFVSPNPNQSCRGPLRVVLPLKRKSIRVALLLCLHVSSRDSRCSFGLQVSLSCPRKFMWPFPGVLCVPSSGSCGIRVQGLPWRFSGPFLVVSGLKCS